MQKSPPTSAGFFVLPQIFVEDRNMHSFIPFSQNEEIAAISRGFTERTLPKAEWTHAAHFAVALWLIANDAGHTMPGMIRAYNEALGGANTDSSGYHETITLASIRAARAFLNERHHLPLYVVCNELMASPLGKSDWLFAYWSRTLLFSIEARRTWVEPDLKPLADG
jgi:hypothetical protein